MTIKSKLIANIVVTTAIIIGISMAGISSMRYLQEKLSYIAEKSTPFQMSIVEFQRELQSCITNLMKVNASRNIQEYSKFRAEAESSLGNAERSQQNLEKMNAGARLGVYEELNQISGELFTASEARIRSDIAASEVNAKVSQQMKESSDRFKELDSHIRTLQVTHAASFAQALEDTGRFSARLRDLEELRNLVKDLVPALTSAHNATNTPAFLIAKGKTRTLLFRIAANTCSVFFLSDIKSLTADVHEFIQLQSDALAQKNDDSNRWAAESLKTVAEDTNHMILTLNQEIELASSKLAIETNKQRTIFARSNSANSILLANSELVALGLTITGHINRLFILSSPTELDNFASEINSLFLMVNTQARQVEKSLTGLNAVNELKDLRSAISSLAAMRSELYSANGIIATIRTKLNTGEQANRSADKLHAMVVKQSIKSKESVSAARDEQSTSIVAVNNMVRRSLSRTVIISSAVIIIAILFGFWIYQSVLLPLNVILSAVRRQREQVKEKAELAEAVAGGDLCREVIVSEALSLDARQNTKDEMGMVLTAVLGMSEAQVTLDRAFAGMTASLRANRDDEAKRDHVKSGLYELNKILRGDHTIAELADGALSFIAAFLGSGVGIMYQYDDETGMLQPISCYAVSKSDRLTRGFRLGEGLAGQAALERKMIQLDSIPPDYLPIASALGTSDALRVVIVPIMHNDILTGVLELGSFKQFDDDDIDFLMQSLEGVAIAIKVNRSRQLVNELLEQTQAQAEELRVQQEELQQTNEELVERARMLAEHKHHMAGRS